MNNMKKKRNIRKALAITKFLLYPITTVIVLVICVSCVSYSKAINESYIRLEKYKIKTFDTEYGIMSFVDEGEGEAIIISHGIFGGYDQGYKNLYAIFGNDYRKIAISRLGY